MKYNNIIETVGNTPLVKLNTIFKDYRANVYAKLEFYNPSSSVKDRIAIGIIEDAFKNILIKEGSTIIEATSGNTGIALAMVGAARGLNVILVMPESMSLERRALLRAYGATLILTPASEGMKGAVNKANEEALANGYYQPLQFDNPVNPLTHYQTTGKEIWQDTEEKIDVLIAGVGTGGTISGCGKFLKEKNPNIKVIGVEPAGSPLLNGGTPGPHVMQGIGANFIPNNYDKSVVDSVIDISNEKAIELSRMVANKEGILAGISSGAALAGVEEYLAKNPNSEETIVVILASYGERYLSTILYKDLLN